MSYLSKHKYCATTFMGDRIEEVLQDVTSWLNAPVNIKSNSGISYPRNKAFYYIDMTTNYDREDGYSITIYHAEIK